MTHMIRDRVLRREVIHRGPQVDRVVMELDDIKELIYIYLWIRP